MADGDFNSSEAKSTSAQRGCGTEQLKTAPLPSSSSGGLPAEVGMEADDESEPNSGDVPGSGGSHQRHAAEEGGRYPGTCHLTGQVLGFRFMVSLFLVHAEEGGPVPGPGGVGGFNGMLARRRWDRCMCAVRSRGLFQREPSSRANSQSPVGEDVGGGLLLVVSQ